MNSQRAFTLIELLIVCVIIGILTAMSFPLTAQFTKRAKSAEAVRLMKRIRENLRDFSANTQQGFYDVSAGNLANSLPSRVTGGAPVPASAGVSVDAGRSQFFSNDAFEVRASGYPVAGESNKFIAPDVRDFLIMVDGSRSTACTPGLQQNCAGHQDAVNDYRLEMDNSGRIFVSYDSGANWTEY